MAATTLSRLTERLADPSLLRGAGCIGGEWVSAISGATYDVLDPATDEVVATLPRMVEADTRAAIEAAAAALPGWRSMLASARSRILRRWADLVREHAADIGSIETAEQGKPVTEAKDEVVYSAGFLDWFAEEGRRVYGDVIPSTSADTRIVVLKQPVGVTAGITPWNLPAAMVTRKVAPALAAGNTMVLKPAPFTPLTALAIAELGIRAGLPPGVLNVVVGDVADAAAIGAELTSNRTVRKIGFTGSTTVGKLLLAQSAPQVKRVSLELGGNSPFIVFDDADITTAVDSLMASKFRNAGQLCTAANRLLVQTGILDDFVAAAAERAGRLVVGHGFDDGTDIGPLISPAGLAKVERHVGDLLDRGGKVVVGGHRHDLGHTFFEPTVVTGLDPAAVMWREETFGPVAGIIPFGDEQEAIDLANDTDYGLVGFVFTRDLGRTWRVSEALETGMVAVNTGRVSGEMAPFGGVKESGLGREGSKYGLEDWLEIKYLNIGGINS
jgi:succinate-semialdehyde dehydrogenase / glutarate-semialdehyde dehydrogenase